MHPRKPRGFDRWDVPVGVLYLRVREDGRWVLLAADPQIKIDDDHDDRIPHLHVGGWNSEDRRRLRPDLGPGEAAEAVRTQLRSKGYIDVEELQEALS